MSAPVFLTIDNLWSIFLALKLRVVGVTAWPRNLQTCAICIFPLHCTMCAWWCMLGLPVLTIPQQWGVGGVEASLCALCWGLECSSRISQMAPSGSLGLCHTALRFLQPSPGQSFPNLPPSPLKPLCDRHQGHTCWVWPLQRQVTPQFMVCHFPAKVQGHQRLLLLGEC